ncbi:MAG: hypothetical protein WC302_02800 [Candidatus Paceibacterota bacterium]|jgi:hypothetical protein
MKYGNVTMGQVEAVINKLGGADGMRRFLSGELVVREIERKFEIWKTVKLGTGFKTADDFRKSLKDNGFKISDWANYILGKLAFTAATEATEVDLVRVTVAELGFEKGARRDQIYDRAKEFGLELCPPEVGPQLRLQYKDQPNNEWILVGMEPITDSDGDLSVFDVRRDDSSLWLSSYLSNPDDVCYPDNLWIFRLPCK